MGDWENIRDKVLGKKLQSISWTSDRAGMLLLIEVAEYNNIAAPLPHEFFISRFREILKDAKMAIAHGDLDQLRAYINMAATFPVADLRIKLGKKARMKIFVREEKGDEINQYSITLTQDQFDRIRRSTAAFFDFQVAQ